MASIYDQSLDEVASQVKTLADAISTALVPGNTIPVVRLDPDRDYEKQFQDLVTVAFDSDSVAESDRGWTNETDVFGYPCFVIFALPNKTTRNDITGWAQDLMEMLPSHFNNQHRMSAVSSPLLACSLPCKVEKGPTIRTERKVFYTRTVVCWYEHLRQS